MCPIRALKRYLAIWLMDVGPHSSASSQEHCCRETDFLLNCTLYWIMWVSIPTHTPPTAFTLGSFQCSSCWTTGTFDPKEGLLDLGLLQDICQIGYTNVSVCGASLKRAETIEINQ